MRHQPEWQKTLLPWQGCSNKINANTMSADWRQIAIAIYDKVVATGQPDHVVRQALSQMNVANISAVLAVGKAAIGMAQSAYRCGVQVDPDKALIIAPYSDQSDTAMMDQHNSLSWPLISSAHPVPDHNSLMAGQRASALCQSLADDDHMLVLLSGGASALMVNPQPPLTLADKIILNERLLASGGDIHQINAVRRLVSQIKGGRMARMTAPAQVTQLIISDVDNDQLSSIASGIMAANPMSLSEHLAVIDSLGLNDLPFMPVLADQLAKDAMLAPLLPDDPVFEHVKSHILASNRQMIHTGVISSVFAENHDDDASPLPLITDYPRLSGEASQMGRRLAEATISAVNSRKQPVIGITGGETVVTLPADHGRGGRSQELALAFAIAMQDKNMPWLILAAGTDGRDGPMDAAGAILNSQMPLDKVAAEYALRHHDAWTILDQMEGLFRPGASGTNLADLVVILAG
ncbi:MAG: glycerate kinase type-2 family protein [Candidatus Puniceispirillales bacterium]